MDEKTTKELAIITLGTLAALPVIGGVGLTLLGVLAW